MINYDEMLNGNKEENCCGVYIEYNVDNNDVDIENEEECEETTEEYNNEEYEKLNNNKIEEKVVQYKEGNTKVFDDIYNYYSPIINRWGIRNHKNDLALEVIDCLLLKALNDFNPSKKTKFNTFFWTYIKTAVKRDWQTRNCKMRVGDFTKISLNRMCTYGKDDNSYELEKKIRSNIFNDDYRNVEFKQALKSVEHYFTENEKFIIYNVIDGKNTRDISEMLGITGSAVSSSLRRIANKKFSSELYKILKGTN